MFISLILNTQLLAQHDSSYYHQFPQKLVITLNQSYIRTSNIEISENSNKAIDVISNINYASETNTYTGIGIDYDVFGLSINFKSADRGDIARKGSSQNSNIAFNFGSNKLSFDLIYRNYKGFYDEYTANYTKDFTEQSPYNQKSNMSLNTYKIKALYYRNHKKFSYKSAYLSTHRQLKSAGSLVFGGKVYRDILNTDSTFIPYQLKEYYTDMQNLNNLSVIGIGAGGGWSGNLVIKKMFFISGTFLIFIEGQHRNYQILGQDNKSGFYTSLGGEMRFSIGYNNKNFMCYLSTGYDYSQWYQSSIDFNNQFSYSQINIAYRFNIKKPKWYRFIEQNKIYKLFLN